MVRHVAPPSSVTRSVSALGPDMIQRPRATNASAGELPTPACDEPARLHVLPRSAVTKVDKAQQPSPPGVVTPTAPSSPKKAGGPTTVFTAVREPSRPG